MRKRGRSEELQSGRVQTAPSLSTTGRNPDILRLLFLDVDGVLHPNVDQQAVIPGAQQEKFIGRCMDALAKILKCTEAKIVLSSSWRQSPAKVAMINEALLKWGISKVWSTTPVSGYETRVEEIDAWLRQFAFSGHTYVDGLLCIDDVDLSVVMDRNGFPKPSRIKQYCLRTPSLSGLSSPHVLRAMTMLMRKVDLRPWATGADDQIMRNCSMSIPRELRELKEGQQQKQAPPWRRTSSCYTWSDRGRSERRRAPHVRGSESSLMNLQLTATRALIAAA